MSARVAPPLLFVTGVIPVFSTVRTGSIAIARHTLGRLALTQGHLRADWPSTLTAWSAGVCLLALPPAQGKENPVSFACIKG